MSGQSPNDSTTPKPGETPFRSTDPASPSQGADLSAGGDADSRPAAPAGAADAAPQAAEAPVNDPLRIAEARIMELESQIADLTDRMLRAHAELDNVRKRSEREKADTAKYAVTRFAQDMVGIADNLPRALSAIPADAVQGAMSAFVDGVRLVDQEFLKTLERHGVRKVEAKGRAFDPHLHQAVMEQEDPSVPAGTILQVYQDGFVIEDRVLRPAMVIVSRGGPKAGKPAPTSDAGAQGSSGPAEH